MPEEKLTTIQIDVETRDKLKVLGEAYERTAAGQLRWLVNQEWVKLDALKLLPRGASTSLRSAQRGRKKTNELPKGA